MAVNDNSTSSYVALHYEYTVLVYTFVDCSTVVITELITKVHGGMQQLR